MQTMTLADFIVANEITMTAERAETNPHIAGDRDWMRDASHYLCAITSPLGTMEVPFSMGPALDGPPTLEMVLDAIASDAAGVLNAPDWIAWAEEYGFDFDDSEEAKRIRASHETTAAQTERLRAILPDEAFETLVWETERL